MEPRGVSGEVGARLVVLVFLALGVTSGVCQCPVGINYGVNKMSQNKMDVGKSIELIKATGASSIKIFDQDENVFKALQGSGIELVVGVMPNDRIVEFADSPEAAGTWLDKNIMPWVNSVNITILSVANECLGDSHGDQTKESFLPKIVPGMRALHNALTARKLQRIKVVTPQYPDQTIDNFMPPSGAVVKPSIQQHWRELLRFLQDTSAPLFLTPYPYYPYIYSKPYPPPTTGQIFMNTDFAFFRGLNGYYDSGGLYYQNLFDVMIDGMLVAAEKLGYWGLDVQVAETGWPSATIREWGKDMATVDNAKDWNQRLLGKVCSGQGTPKRPGKTIRTWLFQAFDEDWKTSEGAEGPYWGTHTWDGVPKYDLSLTTKYDAPPVRPPPQWCTPKEGTDSGAVAPQVQWACSQGGVDCATIRSKCPTGAQAAAIYNAYFQAGLQRPTTCDFGGTGMVSETQPAAAEGCPLPGRPTGAQDKLPGE